jgi:Calcineurin-like phosphoesterase
LRTLVVSDLHLASRTRADVLRRGALEGLLEALAGCDRLVLLGDVIELRHGPVASAFAEAAPVLRAVGEALGAEREVVIVPGNHDHHLAAAWLQRRTLGADPGPLGLESPVDWQAAEPLATVAGSLAAANVSAAYPGIWLREDIYATHGHYLDRHTTVPALERIGAGVMARVLRERDGGPASAEDYEATLAPLYAWVHAIAQAGGRDIGDSARDPSMRGWRTLTGSDGRRSLRRRAVITAFPALVAAMNRAGIGPLKPQLSGHELRRAGLRAFAEVVSRLAIPAPYVIFGHTHRAGPLPADDQSQWRTEAGSHLINSGSWVHQPDFLGDDPSASPYRAGFGVVVDERGAPELVNLLDGVTQPVLA